MRQALSCMCLCLLVILPCASEASGVQLSGFITDSHGVALSSGFQPRVLIHWDASGTNIGLQTNIGIATDMSVQPDTQGRFQVQIPPGFYDIFVSAFAFSPKCAKVRVKPGESTTFNAKLQVDGLVTKELADRPF